MWPSAAVFEPAPPAQMALTIAPFDVTPDGEYRWLARASFRDAGGVATRLLHGGNVAFRVSRGSVQWQTRFRFGAPAAIVATTEAGPLRVAALLTDPPGVPEVSIVVSPRVAKETVVVRALGPHLAQIGWFPRVMEGTVRIERRGSDRSRQLVLVAPPAATYRDATARPGVDYRYTIGIPGMHRVTERVAVPPEPPHGSILAFAGKSMWLSFSPDEADPDAAGRFDPQAMIALAARSGIDAIELRTAYGPFWEITPAVRPAVDALIDAAAARRIAVVGWTVPRSVAFDDLALGVATSAYRTARGNGFAALAVDVERGEGFLGNGAAGRAAIVDTVHRLRQALGPRYPLIATVEDPSLERLDERDYPYAEIAANVDALQPMTYWRMLGAGETTPQGVRAAVAGSYATTRALARRSVPLIVGGQTSAVGSRGASSPGELSAAIGTARSVGALGVTFFDWTGTSDAQWAALGATPWR